MPVPGPWAMTWLLVVGVPEVAADWYRSVVGLARDAPAWLRTVAEIGTEVGLLLFAALFLAAWWRARRRDACRMALALLAPVATVGAYLLSEATKLLVRQERPCRDIAELIVAHCPPVGDWSFPSNHATIAAAAAVAITVNWRRWALLVLPWAALLGFSRVFVGVHYPHDVAGGFVLGLIVAPLLLLLLVRPVTALVVRLRETRLLRPALTAGDPETGGDGRGRRPRGRHHAAPDRD